MYFNSHITFYLWKFDLPLFYILYSFPYIFEPVKHSYDYVGVSMDWFLFYYRYYLSAFLTAQFF